MTTEEEQSWIDWLPDIRSEIEGGTFDDFVLDIIASAMTRVTDEAGLKGVAQLAISSAKKLGFVKSATDTPASVSPDPFPEYGKDFTGAILGETKNAVPSTWSSTRVINFNGKKYLKFALESEVVRIKLPAHHSQWFLSGVLVRIHSCGTKNARARFEIDPTPAHPDSYKLREYWEAQQNNASTMLVVPYEYIEHAFQRN